MRPDAGARIPRATYRLQLQPAFGFDEAARVADYLAALGVSHVYSSPYLQAAPGSTHGYDVVDPRRVNAELGGPVAHQRFSTTLGENDLGQILDIVPNHMAIGADNPWWWDVLENGPASRYARFFDVEWDAPDPRFRPTVLLPVLGDHYGRVLEAGEITLERERSAFVLRYGERTFPVAPLSLGALLVVAGRRAASDELVFIGEAYAALPASTSTDRESVARRHRGKEVLRLQLGRLLSDRTELATVVDEVVAELNGDVDRLDDLIGAQNYRLAFWRLAREDLDYRRFFDVTELAGLSMHDEHVFSETHELILEWLRDGTIDGVRVDHPDGLLDPKTYFERLASAAPRAWIVAEKILEPGEDLPADWVVAGTTGYDFLNLIGRLYTDPRGERPLTVLYRELTGLEQSFAEVAYDAKKLVLRQILAAELSWLTAHFTAVARGHRRHRDYTPGDVREALVELIAQMPVYRTYVRAAEGVVADADEAHVEAAVKAAATARPELPADLLGFIADVLLLRITGERESEWVMRFQQLTGPVMAKGVEDTAFYRYARLASANEVGGDPALFSTSVEEFHAACAAAQAAWPGRMLASSTHDTKRSEDVRARIALLSEIPERWRAAVTGWFEHNARYRGALDANTEYLIYQTLVGAWPIDTERLLAYVEKATREQKIHTSWTDPNAAYEAALHAFVEGILHDAEFTAELAQFVESLSPAWQISSLAQTLLKLTAPGVPDIYQGTELWDFSLVDPDNRRSVDYELRRGLLERARGATADDVLAELDEGLPKIWLVSRVLGVRARRSGLFGAHGTYQPIAARGVQAEHVVAFARGGEAVVVAPRLVARLGAPHIDWGDTMLDLPGGTWRDQLSGERHDGGAIVLGDLLRHFPMALLLPEVL